MTKAKRPLDAIDKQILSVLFKDASVSNKEVAAQIGLAPSSCLERMKRLQSDNIIHGHTLQVDFDALGGHIQAMVSVRLSNHDRQTVDHFQQALLPLPEVISVFHMGGENDFLVHITVNNTAHLRDFVFNAITARQEVNHVETALVYDFKTSHTLPITHDSEDI